MSNPLTKAADTGRSFLSDFRVFLRTLLICFRQDPGDILIFTILCTVFSLIVTTFVDDYLGQVLSSLSGFPYLNMGNMALAARSPMFILYALLFIFLSAFLSLFEIAGLLHAYAMAQVGRETNLPSMLAAGYRTCRKTLKPKNWGVILYLMVLLPLTGVITLSSAGYKMHVPYFILQGIEANRMTNVIYKAVYLILLVLVIVYLFAINVYVLQDVSFSQALKLSRKLSKGRVLYTLATLILFTMILNIAINSIASVIPINIAEFLSVFDRSKDVMDRQQVIGFYVYPLRQFIRSIIAPPINSAGLTVLFFRYLEESESLSAMDRRVFISQNPDAKKFRRSAAVFLGIQVLMLGILAWNYRFLLEPVDEPLVCAHRGDNVHAPENTYPAIELALLENMPWVEVDVIQTSDGVVVCSHDYSLARVTGNNLTISTSTFEEVEQCTMGSWMPGTSEEEPIRVPTLESIVQLVKENDGNLQIELKPTSHDKNLEEEVIRLIHKYEMEDHVMVISLHSNSIKRVKELDPTITTAVCVNLAWRDFRDVTYTDNMSAADNTVNPLLVKQMHDAGIKVFCWTVDSMDDVQYLVSCDVDVIGTNDPLRIQEAIYLSDCEGGLVRVFHVLMNAFTDLEYRTND